MLVLIAKEEVITTLQVPALVNTGSAKMALNSSAKGDRLGRLSYEGNRGPCASAWILFFFTDENIAFVVKQN